MEDISKFSKDAQLFYDKAFNRNIGILTEEEQKKLKKMRIAIAGAGAVGGLHLINLVRVGIGCFTIADMDSYDIENFQRQQGAYIDTIGKNKSETMKNIALSINPHLNIKSFPGGISKDNIDEFLSDADILIDGIDFFSIDTRRMLFQKAREKNIYAITAGPLGFGSALLVFSPDGMSFDEYFDIREGMGEIEKLVAFGVGLAPAAIHMKYLNLESVSLKSKKGPSLVSACNLCSSFAVTEVLRILLNRKGVRSAPHYFQFDPYEQKYKKGYLLGANKHPWQMIKRWFLLKRFLKGK